MRFLRPEARAALWRWRDVLLALGLVLLGLWAFVAFGGLLHWLGALLALFGLGFGLSGWQRARFGAGAGGPGVVTLDEGRLGYFGPFSGGAVALSELSLLELDGRGEGARWRLHQPGQAVVEIPVDAENAEVLFDAFALLPGLRTERMLAELRSGGGGGSGRVVIWRREGAVGHGHTADVRRLH